jgi:hypothetical protein
MSIAAIAGPLKTGLAGTAFAAVAGVETEADWPDDRS